MYSKISNIATSVRTQYSNILVLWYCKISAETISMFILSYFVYNPRRYYTCIKKNLLKSYFCTKYQIKQ